MAGTFTLNTLVFALVGGIMPALIWLWFWLREDRENPEPKKTLLISFVAGMATVLLVLPFQRSAWLLTSSITTVFILWAIIEEIAKFGIAWFFALRKPVCNEPIDPIIYLITVALGFAALENSLFILGSLTELGITEGIATGNLRFMGSTLLHTLSSATIGVFMAFTYNKSDSTKRLSLLYGIIIAIALHAGFNLFIINDSSTLLTFSFVWTALAVLILLFERLKEI